MTGAENKVKYNIKNVHVAKQTEKTTEGATTYTYDTPKRTKMASLRKMQTKQQIRSLCCLSLMET